MKTLSNLDLALVTGGKDSPPANIAGASGNSDSNLLCTLQGIQSSLADLGKNNNGLFGGSNALLLVTMAVALGRRSQVVVYGGNCRRGFSWRVW